MQLVIVQELIIRSKWKKMFNPILHRCEITQSHGFRWSSNDFNVRFFVRNIDHLAWYFLPIVWREWAEIAFLIGCLMGSPFDDARLIATEVPKYQVNVITLATACIEYQYSLHWA